MTKLKMILQLIRVCFILPGINWQDEKFSKDLIRWKHLCHIDGSNCIALAQLLWEKKEFRNLVIYRNNHRIFFRRWIALWYRPLSTLYIEAGEIGGGLFIQHGFSTMIAAKSIGENCWINQQVTVGHKAEGPPVIGNNVMITCGAKVLGNITIGDGAVIGANAVVIRDVDPGAVMGGVPAKKIK
jgi:serine O-acetyltransferase